MFTAIGHLALCFGNAFLCQEIALITAIFITVFFSHYLIVYDFIIRFLLKFLIFSLSHYLNFDNFILRSLLEVKFTEPYNAAPSAIQNCLSLNCNFR